MNRHHIIIILIGAFFIISALTMLIYTSLSTPLETSTIGTNATVVSGKLVGFNVNTEVLTFGQVPQGGVGRRYVILSNLRNDPITVKVISGGNISAYLYVNQSTFSLAPNEIRNYSISFEPTTAEYGYYEGNITFVYYKKYFFMP